MIDSDIVRIEEFLGVYIQQFLRRAEGQSDVEANLRMKYSHTLAVHALARKLAAELHLDDETSLRVRAAALLHDVGRFPQIIEHRTYEDVISTDHAYLGVEIIEEHGLIAHLGTEASEAVEAAVRHHNKLTLAPELGGQARIVAEVLRDADKIDIIRISIEFHASELEGRVTGWFTEMSFSPTCNPIAAAALLAGKPIPIAELGTVYDEFLLYLSWVNDLHFDPSVRYLTDVGQFEYMVHALPDDSLRDRVAEYITRRINERCFNRTFRT